MNTSPASAKTARQGFTLIELMVVIAIILVLMGLVIGISGAAQRSAAEARARSEIGQIVLAVEQFRADRGRYPNNLRDDFFTWYQERFPNTVFDMTDSTGEGVNRRMIDPWGQEYVYVRDSDFVFRVGSRGPDRRLGSAPDANNMANFGTGDDITSRRLN